MAKRGPKGPQTILDIDELKKLAGMGCTMKEMAAFFGCSVASLERNYAEVIEGGRETGKASIRRTIIKHFEKTGNQTCVKYLVHNVLKEKMDDGLAVKLYSDEVSKMSDEQLKTALLEKLGIK